MYAIHARPRFAGRLAVKRRTTSWKSPAVTPTNGTSLSVELPANLQQLVMARRGSYAPLWSHFLS